MKVTFKTNDGRLAAEVEGDSQKQIFTELARFQEIFENNTCGKCSNTNTRFVVRTVEDNSFFEMHCMDIKCRAKLAFGQHKGKEGTLFPRRKDEEGKYLPNGGWTVWTPEAKS